MEELIKIEITTPEAILFRAFQANHQAFMEFQKFHATFQLLCQKGVFDQKNGSITIHFDSLGNIGKIERNDSLYDSRIK